jgi:hypothetical protein
LANPEHLEIVRRGPEEFTRWRDEHQGETLDLSDADLRRADFVHMNLSGAILKRSRLEWADFRWADLIRTDFRAAMLSRADFHKADLAESTFSGADLSQANFEDANCQGADFSSAIFNRTRLLNTDLSKSRGLASVHHAASSLLDPETIAKSGDLPKVFLRGCGVNEAAIRAAYRGDRAEVAIRLADTGEHFSCFVSHSARDRAFAERLHEDLQQRGVRCWYAPQDLKIGERILDGLYRAIRHQEKLLLILSDHSVRSTWVRDEVDRAFAEETDRGDLVVFPVRIDDAVMEANEPWALKIRTTRHIGDFRGWRLETEYKSAFERLVRDLRKESSEPAGGPAA